MKFESFKNARVVRSSWLQESGRRLDCNPYMSGALEARETLKRLAAPKDNLKMLTTGHAGGIYNGPIFRRHFVESPEFGVPFVTSGPILLADLSTLPLLRKKDAQSTRLSYLKLKAGTTLISCSGTIGRMVYVRPDMDGMWSSQDVLKIVPNESKIHPGYLYAFLSSKFGVPLVIAGTYGAIIQHIEPEHVANLPVPRFDSKTEFAIGKLADEAAKRRAAAVHLIQESHRRLVAKLGLSAVTPSDKLPKPDVVIISSGKLKDRCDAFYHSAKNREARTAFDNAGSNIELCQIAEVFIPGIFKRLYASDPTYGSPYVTGGDVFELSPTSNKYLLRRVAEEYRLLLKKGMIVIQEAGQLGGLIGRSVMVGEYLDGFSCSNNMIRVVPKNDVDAGYLFALLSSEYGVRIVSRESAGSSIPHTDESRVKRLCIPWPSPEFRAEIGEPAIRARGLRDEAAQLENEARKLVERQVEQGQ